MFRSSYSVPAWCKQTKIFFCIFLFFLCISSWFPFFLLCLGISCFYVVGLGRFRGSLMVKVVPRSGMLSSSIVPCRSST